MITVKRVYDPPSEEDGERILVDRLWPRGVTKDAARLSSWLKELGPTSELRKWFSHDPSRWEEFQRRYVRELQSLDKQSLLRDLAERSRHGVVTLIFGAKDRERNNAVVLKKLIKELARKSV
jgi:uncharacterized protein YeaO (DUF488 family)